MRYLVFLTLLVSVWACNQRADMYEASELSELMRVMVDFSESAKEKLEQGEAIGPIPTEMWDLRQMEATRGEHEEAEFQAMAIPYLQALKGIERGDSQAYFYRQSIDACRTCHTTYCGGPLEVINTL